MHNGLLLALGKVKKLVMWKGMNSGQTGLVPTRSWIRNLCQAVAPGELRSPSTECVRGLSWRRSHDHDHDDIDGSCGATDDAHADYAAKPNDALCSYGFDSEVMLAWRAETPRCRLRSHKVLLIQMRSRLSGQTVIAKPILGFTSAVLDTAEHVEVLT